MTILTAESQTCPRRGENPGPWKFLPAQDMWVSDRWSATEAEDEAKAAEFLAKYPPPSSRGSDLWKWSWGPPRTCSYCGGIHPEDAIRLVSEGWEVEPTTKGYKRYLGPPGTLARHEAMMASIKDHGREPGEGVPSVWSPTPPVKVYCQHFDEDQVRRFNAAIEGEKGR